MSTDIVIVSYHYTSLFPFQDVATWLLEFQNLSNQTRSGWLGLAEPNSSIPQFMSLGCGRNQSRTLRTRSTDLPICKFPHKIITILIEITPSKFVSNPQKHCRVWKETNVLLYWSQLQRERQMPPKCGFILARCKRFSVIKTLCKTMSEMGNKNTQETNF